MTVRDKQSDSASCSEGRADNTSRLRWQCRRGMRELDQLLSGYLDRRYDAASEAEKSAFRRLLELSDPELVGYLLQKQTPAPDIAVVVQHLIDRSDA